MSKRNLLAHQEHSTQVTPCGVLTSKQRETPPRTCLRQRIRTSRVGRYLVRHNKAVINVLRSSKELLRVTLRINNCLCACVHVMTTRSRASFLSVHAWIQARGVLTTFCGCPGTKSKDLSRNTYFFQSHNSSRSFCLILYFWCRWDDFVH